MCGKQLRSRSSRLKQGRDRRKLTAGNENLVEPIKWFPKQRWLRSERITYDLRIPEMADDFIFLLRPHRDHFATIIKGVCASESVRLHWVRPGESDGFRSAV